MLGLLLWLGEPAAAQSTPTCFSTTTVSEACCSATSSCKTNGIPDLCDSDCANVFTPWYSRCRSSLAAMPNANMREYDDFAALCTAVNSGSTACPLEATLTAQVAAKQRQIEALQHRLEAKTSTVCCEAQSNWNGRFAGSAVCGFSPRDSPGNGGACVAPKGLTEAEGICMNKGGRLCSVAELLAGEASSTGCSLDGTRVWSSTVGTCPNGYAVTATDRTGSAECTIISERLPVRCCADFCGESPAGATAGPPSPPSPGPPTTPSPAPPSPPSGAPPRLPAPSGPGYTRYGADPTRGQGWAAPPPRSAKNVLMLVSSGSRSLALCRTRRELA